ncbi:MAG: hypothetical protein WAQ25_03900 [Candidatus Saccharimonas sp.]
MKKALIISTAATLLGMSAIAVSGVDTGFHLFMNTGIEHSIARVVLAVALLVILVTSRPRSAALRGLLGAIALVSISFAVSQTLNYQLGLFDTLVYFLAGLVVSIESLELEPESSTEQSPAFAAV